MGLWTLLANAARQHPERAAISIGTRPVCSYGGLAEGAARLAAGLARRHGLVPGDRVAMALRNRPEVMELFFACWHGGFVAVPINAKLHPHEIAQILEDSGAAVLVAEDEIATALGALPGGAAVLTPEGADFAALIGVDAAGPASIAPGDVAWLFYTSGTTGRPKGAMLTHRNLLVMALGYLADVDALDARDNLLHIAATSHASGLFGLSFVARAAGHILPESGGYEADELAGLIAEIPRLSFFVPPTLLRRMVDDPVLTGADHANLRTILLGAMPVRPGDLTAGVAAFGPRLWNGYGQGETPCMITAMSKHMVEHAVETGDTDRLASVGVARTGIDLRLVDEAGLSVPTGEVGEVMVRGETVMAGYWRNPDATAATLRDGWLATGDMGRLDDRGYLTLLDRKKDVIISGGSNIYAREVEDALIAHPDIAEVAVIGLPDADWGETVVAVIVPAPGRAPAPEALDLHCTARLARFKRPRRIVTVDALPRNAVGKVLKRDLRESLAGRDSPNEIV